MSSKADPPPSAQALLSIAQDAYANLPDNLLQAAQGVVILVKEFPDEEIQRELGLDSPYDLLGLYEGVSMLDKSVLDTPISPDTVTLYRQPILDYWQEGTDSLDHLVRHVLIHEIGHHFGLSDDDMARVEETD
ncbi:metallopeptidase family protein [Magnetovibrio sp. PR-2]|uniref:metallopeptidase family protein n=1 Tax=Magnetovibrio sp. PR-2 TaxID=3120356 RepID=UPI002FCE4890